METQSESNYAVMGRITNSDGEAQQGLIVRAYDRDLRKEQSLGEARTDRQGAYAIRYSRQQFRRSEKESADLVVKVFDTGGKPLAESPVQFNAPRIAKVDVAVSADALTPPTLFERIASALIPLLDGLAVAELEESAEHRDLSFLSGETGFSKSDLVRFVLGHRIAARSLPAEFWFALLGDSFYVFEEDRNLAEQLATLLKALPTQDAVSVRKALQC